MRRASLLLSGVPRYVTLPDLSYNLDRLFNTDEIGTFKIRDLPNRPQANRRQIALDFLSSFDAMVAQEQLEGYEYTMEDGQQYTLRAKINKAEEYMCKNSHSPEQCGSSSWYGADWQTLALLPNLDGEMYHRANAQLDAQLDLLKKQQLVIEKKKEVLREKRRLKREYGNMHAYDDSEASSFKRSRSRSRERRSSSWHRRSRSRERATERSSKDHGSILPQIEWHDEERAKRSDHRSRSKDESESYEKRTSGKKSGSLEHGDPRSRKGSRQRSKDRQDDHGSSRDRISRSRSREWVHRKSSKEQMTRSYEDRYKNKRSSRERNYRDLQSTSKERRASRDGRSRSKERRSRSNERGNAHRRSCSKEKAYRNLSSTSRERVYRTQRSRSKEGTRWSRERPSKSREHMRSSHEQRSTYRRSRDRNTHFSDPTTCIPWTDWRPKRSSERRPNLLLAIMPGSPKRLKSPIGRAIVSYVEDCTPIDNMKSKTGVQGEKEVIKVENEDENTVKEEGTPTNKNKQCNIMEDKLIKKQINKEEKRLAKFNSTVEKAKMLEARVKEFTKDVMVLLIILLKELMNKDKFRLSASNKVLLIKKLKTVVEKRVEPLARSKKSTDVEVLWKYKKIYPREVDLLLINQMLDKIPKIQVLEPQSTATDNDIDNCPDEVVLIEKPHDVVSVPDSDDEEDKKPIIDVTNLECSPARDMPRQSCSLKEPGPTVLITVNTHDNPTKQLAKKENKKTATAVDAEMHNLESQETGHSPEPRDNTIRSSTAFATDTQVIDSQNNPEMIAERMSQTPNDYSKDNQVEINKTERIQEYVSNTLKDDPVQNSLNAKEIKEENDSNNLKVTAITIVTSLDDLLAKTTYANNSEEVPVHGIKEELEYDEDRPDDSSLQLVPDSGPVVTSITIMTSDVELFSIGQDGHKQVNEIKNEEEDAYENLLHEIERDINNDKFSLKMNKEYENFNNSMQTGTVEHNVIVINSEFTSDNTIIPQESRTEDDDETIESIGRFLASMY